MTLRRNYDESQGDTLGRSMGQSKQQYEILLQFDLKREKEKNLILEERLRNKEIFIQQMKGFQQEITAAYQQCKNELILAKQKVEYLQNVQFRQYTEQIADLKHMLLLKTNQQRDSAAGLDKTAAMSVRNNQLVSTRQSANKFVKSTDKRDSRAASNAATRRDSKDKIDDEIKRESKKVSDFLTHFLQMTQIYLPQLERQTRFSKKLKRSWKWVKQVVKEWDQKSKQAKIHNDFKGNLASLFKVASDVDNSILLEMVRASKQTNH